MTQPDPFELDVGVYDQLSNEMFDLFQHRTYGLALPSFNQHGFVGPEYVKRSSLFVGTCDLCSPRPPLSPFYWWEYQVPGPVNTLGYAGTPIDQLVTLLEHYLDQFVPRVVWFLPSQIHARYVRLSTGEHFAVFKGRSRLIRYMRIKGIITTEQEAAMMDLYDRTVKENDDSSVVQSKFLATFETLHQLQKFYKFTFRWSYSPVEIARDPWSHIMFSPSNQIEVPEFATKTYVGPVVLQDVSPDGSPGPLTHTKLYDRFTHHHRRRAAM